MSLELKFEKKGDRFRTYAPFETLVVFVWTNGVGIRRKDEVDNTCVTRAFGL